jgi:tyrosinase
VLCLQKKPPTTPLSIAPGVRSRYDDFVGTHINQTLFIHSTGNFLGWHRYYVWTYEQALRKECGYQGHQPYWNWGKYALDPVNSALFDGSDESLSGDGFYFNHTPIAVPGAPPPFDVIKPGNGGGCVTSGPFKDMVVSLGPVAGTLDGVTANPTPDGFSYNPRCLRRDISENAAVSTRTNATVSLLTTHDNIADFQDYMQGIFAKGILGVHGGGHFTVGGDPGGYFFASSGDPAFWLHHANVDRIWWIWQNQDLATRQNAIAGQTHMAGDGVPTTLEDDQFFQVNEKVPKLKDLLTTLGGADGEFCYIYQ